MNRVLTHLAGKTPKVTSAHTKHAFVYAQLYAVRQGFDSHPKKKPLPKTHLVSNSRRECNPAGNGLKGPLEVRLAFPRVFAPYCYGSGQKAERGW